MNMRICALATLLIWLNGLLTASHAVTVPFTENFATGTANWKDVASLDLTHVVSGGPDGGAYVSTDTAFTNAVMDSTILFRGHDMFNSSGDAFVGNWLAADVRQLRAYVRHNAPEPLEYFVRLATPFNFPGVIFGSTVQVPPNTWALLEFDISPTNPLLTIEGPPGNYNTTLSNVGNIQLAAHIPAALANDPTAYMFGLDQVAIAVPEPASVLLFVGTGVLVLMIRQIRRD
jgi:hypothetical protein